MSDDGSMAAGSPGETNPDDAARNRMAGERPGSAASQTQDQLCDFVIQQPFTAAIMALVIGYLLGKIT